MGAAVGTAVGHEVGAAVGEAVRAAVGAAEGNVVGNAVAFADGAFFVVGSLPNSLRYLKFAKTQVFPDLNPVQSAVV